MAFGIDLSGLKKQMEAKVNSAVKGAVGKVTNDAAKAATDAATKPIRDVEREAQKKVREGEKAAQETVKGATTSKPQEPKKPEADATKPAVKADDPKKEGDAPKEESWLDKMKRKAGEAVDGAKEFHDENSKRYNEQHKNDAPGNGFDPFNSSNATDVQTPASLLAENKASLTEPATPAVAEVKQQLAAAPSPTSLG